LSKFHTAIDMRQEQAGNMSQQGFRCGGCKFSGDGNEILAGSHTEDIAVYDLVKDYKTVAIKKAHSNDINSVCFANRENSHIIYTVSDDCMVKVWDRRILYNNKAIGCFIGHTQGLTHVDSRGDERYLISTSKDQTIKLWDLRKMNSMEEYKTMKDLKSVYGFDYRMHDYPYPHNPHKHELDNSVSTFTGFE
jgi:DDB1- and CUL4-associated factor 11